MMTITLHDEPARCISDSDLAVLADWASKQRHLSPDSGFRRCFAMIREGADTLLRRRARATEYTQKGQSK